MSREVVWLADDCTCQHGPDMHDDGFGCTDPDCPCLAQWGWEDVFDLGEDW